MSIASEISRISGNVADAYTAANAKGATMPVSQNSDNLATTISTIPSGITPTGTKSITANGVYDVTDFASADVQVPTTAPAHYVEKTVDINGKLINSTNIINLNGATDVFNYTLYGQYYGVQFPSNTNADLSTLTKITGVEACKNMFGSCRGLTSVDLSGLTAVSGPFACQYMFSYCNSLTSVDLSSLTTINTNSACNTMFQGCTSLTSVDLSSLTTISGDAACTSMFLSCSILTGTDLSSLTTISGNNACNGMFGGCALTSVDLSSLSTISGQNACQYMFQNCSGLTSVDLSGLTTIDGRTACQYMFQGCTGITSVNLSNLTTVNGQETCNGMFQGCIGLTSVDLSGLATISGQSACVNMFKDCGLTSVYLKSLKRIENYSARVLPLSQMFGNCPVVDLRNLQYAGNYTIDSLCYLNNTLSSINLNSLEHIGTEGARTLLYLTTPSSSLSNIYFPMLTSFGSNPFYTNAFTNRTNLTIHFRKDAQATVEALPNYATLWGAGTGSSVVFDLAGTLTGADSNSYARSEKDSMYASETAGAAKTATAWSYNNTIYYTPGGTEPSVGDTIYSDSACTQAVTTISSIA